MSPAAFARILWDNTNDQANRYMEDAFSQESPFTHISGHCPETSDGRGNAWGAPFEPRQVITNEPGLVEFSISWQAPNKIFQQIAEMFPAANFLMLETTECMCMEEPPVPAIGYFLTHNGQLGKVKAPAEFDGTLDELFAATETATRRHAQLEAEGALTA